jgi:dUTP pyrophosphatase
MPDFTPLPDTVPAPNWNPPLAYTVDASNRNMAYPHFLSVRIKRLDDGAVMPSYAKVGDAGLDLTACSMWHSDTFVEYGTGIAIEIPHGFVGLIFPRSSISKLQNNFSLRNSVGVIDSGYRGEIKLRFSTTAFGDSVYQIGDKVGQLIIMQHPTIILQEVEELNESDRGAGGFGSTGK